jgi:hypothetical protein
MLLYDAQWITDGPSKVVGELLKAMDLQVFPI